VRGEEPWIRELVDVVWKNLLAGVDLVLQELDALVGAEGAERVDVGGVRGMLSAVHGGEQERLDPRRAGLGQGGDDDVRRPRGEARVRGHGAGYAHLAAVPSLVVTVELEVGQSV